MAKKINPEESLKPETAETAAPAAESPVGADEKKEEKAPKAPETVSAVAGVQSATNPHTLELLKKFPSYESLYIDTHGGTFAPGTPAAIRGTAVLYKNPYYNELKKTV